MYINFVDEYDDVINTYRRKKKAVQLKEEAKLW